ncbi:MAG: hypothetical protein PHS44_06425 [Candidatus Dojkabacteria bacterium]|nr:hypothetical protein [Candidatus Dojkabacteria bacterium]
MRKIISVLGLILAVFVLVRPIPARAAPAPWGIAINEETKECGGYWAGDEFHHYALPFGWEAYYPDYVDGESIIETPEGSCDFGAGEKSCCEDLGLSYVSENVAIVEGEVENDETDAKDKVGGMYSPMLVIVTGLACCFVVLVLVVITVFFVVKKKK